MPVDASIYGQLQQPKLISPMESLLGAYRLQEAQLGAQAKQREFAADEAYREAARQSGGDMNQLYKLLSTTDPKRALELQKTMDESANKRADTSHKIAQSGKLLSETDALKMTQHRDQLTEVNTPQDAIQWAQNGVTQGIMKPEQFQMALKSIELASQSPEAFNQWKQQNALGMTKYIELNKPTTHFSNIGGQTIAVQTPGLGGPSTQSGTWLNSQSPDSIANNARIAAEGAANRAQSERHFQTTQANANKENGKPPSGYAWGPVGADGNPTLIAVKGGPADLKLAGQLNQDTQALSGSMNSFDRLAVAANEVLNHPGLASISGLRGAIPNIPGTDAANAQALLGTLKSQVGFGVLQDMRNNSKTGGALGNVSDAEGKRLEANLAALDKSQSVEQLRTNLKKIIDYAEGAKGRLREAYNLKHGTGSVNPAGAGYPTGQPPADVPKVNATKAGASVSNW